MRITIEDTDSKVMTAAAAASFSNATTPGTTQQPIDAGAPSASLLQGATSPAMTGATDGGTPPESLLQAIQSASTKRDGTSSYQLNDAGAAPTV